MSKAKLTLEGEELELPIVKGTEGEVAFDIRRVRSQTGAITLDPGYGNTGSCQSAITFINGEEGVLHHRGYPIEQLAEKTSFEEVAYLLIWGELPTESQLTDFRTRIDAEASLPERLRNVFNAFHRDGHPMGIVQATVAALSTYYEHETNVDNDIISLMAKMKAIAANAYRVGADRPYVYPGNELSYAADFLRMMSAPPSGDYEVDATIESAINKLLILHADHEQNCSAATVRMVGSSKANLYASIAAGVGALWGPLHGGANQAVIEMLEQIEADGSNIDKYIDLVKDKSSDFRLMGFGHRVYKNFDPRARILKKSADSVLEQLGVQDPLLDLAKRLEERALQDDYFVERKLYPNVDFYSGIIYRALGIPTRMFTVMFALGRLPGWIAQWKEMRDDTTTRIYRPRQVYVGPTKRDVSPLSERG